MTTKNEKLLEALKGREPGSFNRGIVTADRYVKTVQECVGTDICYKYAAKGHNSWADQVKSASKRLTYNDDEMIVEETYDVKAKMPEGIELPPNTLLVMRHVITSSKMDRDGDILRPDGAQLDPKMLLLWQHIPTLPIGKMLTMLKQSSRQITVLSAIVDMNQLCHDAATMVKNGMGRYSHGFRALDWKEIETGFDVKSYEMMEESLVSIPSNTDADTQEVVLDMVEGGKLTSPFLKEYGKTLRSKRPLSVAAGYSVTEKMGDVSVTVSGPDPEKVMLLVKSNAKTTLEEPEDDEPAEPKEVGDCSCKGEQSASNEESNQPASSEGSEETGNDEVVDKTSTPTETKNVVTDTKSYYGYMENSWEDIREKLQTQGRKHIIRNDFDVEDHEYCFVFATYSDRVIFCCCESYWYDDDQKYYQVNWEMTDGEPKLTGSVTEITIESKLVEKMFELFRKDAECFAAEKEISVKEAMELVVLKATPEQKKTFQGTLDALQQVKRVKSLGRKFR